MSALHPKTTIENGRAFLGIEFGSTRIKAVLIDEQHAPIASGSFTWENKFENKYWTYSQGLIWDGLQRAFAELNQDVEIKFGIRIHLVAAIGFSGMMHGYLPFDSNGQLLVPFRTWRNTTTGTAAAELTDLFKFNIPQRWSIAHLWQAILNNEEHIGKIDHLTTLAGYVHWAVSGQKMIGIGEASGMFPMDSSTKNYDQNMLSSFNQLLHNKKLPYTLEQILPAVKLAGEPAGVLSQEGAKLIDPSGGLQAGIPLCPPEGDAGTGMVATNSIMERTGNVSAGTSVFAMIVLQNALSKHYPQIDMVTTPAGSPVAMVHSNNCTSDLNDWVELFAEYGKLVGHQVDTSQLYSVLYKQALQADPDGGGMLAYNYLSGEHLTGLEDGRPVFIRSANSNFTLPNFIRTHLFASIASLKIGMDILTQHEKVKLEKLLGHGGFFKTEDVGQRIMAAGMNVPVAVMETAGEGGPWGMSILAAYMVQKFATETLEDYLNRAVFADAAQKIIEPDQTDVEGFAKFMQRFQAGLPIEEAAIRLF